MKSSILLKIPWIFQAPIFIVLFRSLFRRTFCFIRAYLVLFLGFKCFFPSDGLLVQRITPNLEDQVICDRAFLPLAFDKSMSYFKAINATLIRPGYFISPVRAISGEHICHIWQKISNKKTSKHKCWGNLLNSLYIKIRNQTYLTIVIFCIMNYLFNQAEIKRHILSKNQIKRFFHKSCSGKMKIAYYFCR